MTAQVWAHLHFLLDSTVWTWIQASALGLMIAWAKVILASFASAWPHCLIGRSKIHRNKVISNSDTLFSCQVCWAALTTKQTIQSRVIEIEGKIKLLKTIPWLFTAAADLLNCHKPRPTAQKTKVTFNSPTQNSYIHLHKLFFFFLNNSAMSPLLLNLQSLCTKTHKDMTCKHLKWLSKTI